MARCVAGCWGGGHVKWCHEVAKLGVPGVFPFPFDKNGAVVEKQCGGRRKNWAAEEKVEEDKLGGRRKTIGWS